jgi:hypothetical protein
MRIQTVWFLIFLILAMVLIGCGASKKILSVKLAQNGKDLVVESDLTNFRMGVDGHLHVQLDADPEIITEEQTYTFPNVTAGKHKVLVRVMNRAHKFLGVSQTVELEME